MMHVSAARKHRRASARKSFERDTNALLARLKNDRAKSAQGYDPDPPRCSNCIYYTRGTRSERETAQRAGRSINAAQRCTFGNFHTDPVGVCNEWRNRAGETIDSRGLDDLRNAGGDA